MLITIAVSSPRRHRGFAAAATSSDVRRPHVVPDYSCKQHRIEPVERAAVRAEQSAGVLRARLALYKGLEQVADRRDERDRDADDDRVRAGQPFLVAPGDPDAEHGAD